MGRALTGQQVRLIRTLRADGYTGAEVAELVGCSPSTPIRIVPGRVGKVPVAPLREAFLKSGKTAADVARAVGWFCTNDHGEFADGSRVKRTLGLNDDVNGKGFRNRRTLIDAETASLLAAAVGVMPWEVLPDEDEPPCTCGTAGPDADGQYDQIDNPDCVRCGPAPASSEKEN